MTFIDRLRRRDPSPITPFEGRNRLELRISTPRALVPRDDGAHLLQAPSWRPRGAEGDISPGLSPTQRSGRSPGPSQQPSGYDGSVGPSAGLATGQVSPMSGVWPPGLPTGPRPPPSPALAEDKAQWRSRAFNLPILEEAKTKRLLYLPDSSMGAPGPLNPGLAAPFDIPAPTPSFAMLAAMPEMGPATIAAWVAAVVPGSPPEEPASGSRRPSAEFYSRSPSPTQAAAPKLLPPPPLLDEAALQQYCAEAQRPEEQPQRAQVAQACLRVRDGALTRLTLSHLDAVHELPQELGMLTGLRVLELIDLSITQLPPLSDLVALEELVVRDCRNLRHLSWTLVLLPKLQQVTLEGLPQLGNLPALPHATVRLRHCPNVPRAMVQSAEGSRASRNLL